MKVFEKKMINSYSNNLVLNEGYSMPNLLEKYRLTGKKISEDIKKFVSK